MRRLIWVALVTASPGCAVYDALFGGRQGSPGPSPELGDTDEAASDDTDTPEDSHPPDTVDTTADSGATDEICIDAPVVNWDNFGHGFVVENCQACHASTAPDRHGAPADVSFDTEAQTAALGERILAVATGEDARMPPMGGVTEDDRVLLEIWLRCWE